MDLFTFNIAVTVVFFVGLVIYMLFLTYHSPVRTVKRNCAKHKEQWAAEAKYWADAYMDRLAEERKSLLADYNTIRCDEDEAYIENKRRDKVTAYLDIIDQ